MRKVFVWMWLTLFLGGLISCVSSGDSSRWVLVWEDDFNGTSFDTATWSKIPRANPEWARHMSDNEACYEMRDGNLVLKGIVNTDLENDTAPYITGGVYTKNKRGFHGGRLEVKAKLQGAQGAWPAIWLKPCDGSMEVAVGRRDRCHGAFEPRFDCLSNDTYRLYDREKTDT